MGLTNSQISRNRACVCDKSFTHTNKPILCEHCKTVRCENCWIEDKDLHFCPYCFQTPTFNIIIVYYNFISNTECPICYDDSPFSPITLMCGHSTCLECYTKILEIQTGNIFNDNLPLNQNLLIECPICKQKPLKYVKGIEYPLHFAREKMPVIKKILSWNLYEIYEHILNQKTVPPKIISKAIIEYRKFICAKIDMQDFDAKILSPAPLVDMIWHTHIMFSQNYTLFCNNINGKYIHHFPNGQFDPQKTIRYKETLNWMVTRLHSIEHSIWLTTNVKSMFVDTFGNISEIQIFITTFGENPTKSILANPSNNIWMLKIKIFYILGINIDEQRLIYSGKNLLNHLTLDYYNIREASTIHLTLGIKGC